MAYPEDDYSADIEYNKRYGDNPNAPGLASVNAVDRSAPVNQAQDDLNTAAIQGLPAGGTLPGVGQAGSTAVTDQTNLNVAAAMERADQAGRVAQAPLPTVAGIAMDEYGQARQEIDGQRREIMAKLGIIKPQEAGYAAMVLAPPHERVALLKNLDDLEKHSALLLREHHYAAMENARTLHEQTALQTGIQVGTGKAKILQVIQDANQQHGVGTTEARDAILKAAGSDDPDIRAALGHKALDTIIKPYVEMHDLAARRAEFVKTFGREPTSIETTATGGVNLRAGKEKDEIPKETESKHADLLAQRAEQQSYLDTDKTSKQADRDKIGKKITALNAKIGAFETRFPSLKGTAPTATVTTAPAATPAPTATPAPAVETVQMKAPGANGAVTPVPKSQVDHYIKLGATIVK